MKSTAKKKTFVNNMITLGMVAAAWLIMEITYTFSFSFLPRIPNEKV